MTTAEQPNSDRSRRLLLGAVSAVLGFPVAAAIVALIWKFPIMMVGVDGGPGAMVGAAFTAGVWMTFFSAGVGLVVTAAIGVGIGALLRRARWIWTSIAALAVALVVAISITAIVVHFERGPAWIHVQVGGAGENQTTLGGHVRDDEPPQPQITVEVRSRDTGEASTTVTGDQGWATIRVPNGDYEVVTRCGSETLTVAVDEHRYVGFRCTD